MSKATGSPTARRVMLWAVVLVVLGAMVAIALRADDQRTTLPLAVGNATIVAQAAAAPVGAVRYRAGDGLPALDGEAPAYRLDGPGEAAVARLADALGLGERLQRDASGWIAVDGERILGVADIYGGLWEYSVGGPDGTVGSGRVEPDGSLPAPDPRAEPAARRFVERAGLALAGADVMVTAGEPTMVHFHPRVGDLATVNASTTVAVDAAGQVAFASGLLGEPEPAGTFALVGTGPAIDRLNRGRGLGLPVGPLPGPVRPSSDPNGPETTIPGSGGAGGTGSSGAEPGSTGPAEGPATTFPSTTGTVPPEGSPGSGGPCAPEPAPPPSKAPPTTNANDMPTCVPPDEPPPPPPCDGDGAPTAFDTPFCVLPDEPPPSPPCDGTGAPTTFACGPAEPGPGGPEPMPPAPEPATVTVTDASVVLAVMPGRDSSTAWLVPAYQLSDAEGPVAVTLAVADDAVDLGPPGPRPEPQPAPTPTPETGTTPRPPAPSVPADPAHPPMTTTGG